MSRKTPQDEYGRMPDDELDLLFPGMEDDSEEEPAYEDGEYLTPDARSAVEPEDAYADEDGDWPEPEPEERPSVKALAQNALDKVRGLRPVQGKKGPRADRKLTRRERKALAKPEWLIRESPAVGRDLRGDQMLVYDSELDEVDYTDDRDLPELRDYLPIRFGRHGRTGVGGGILYGLFVISLSVVLACMAWMFASDMLALNKEPVAGVVTIAPYEPTGDMPLVNEEGAEIKVDIDQVASALKNAGIIEYRWLFKLFSQVAHANTKIDPGTYDVTTDDDYYSLVLKMQFGSGSQEITRVTFPEGYTMEQIFTTLEENNICRIKDLYEAAANHEFDYDFLADIELGDASRLEGFLFPDTYDFYQGESAVVSINRFLQNTARKLTDDIIDGAAERGLTIREVLIMASLIEKEAGSADEMPIMASVINNRLRAGMPLQLDSTLNYIKGTSTFDLTDEDMQIDSPYNTYMYEGLPIGPICNPGIAAIRAVIDPDRTDYWYWYSVEGESHFFTNYEDFNAFAAANPY